MINVAILGYGVVGSGVARVLERNAAFVERKAGAPVRLKRVLDLREFPGSPVEPLLTHDFNEILNDPDVHVVVEVMGGTDPAYAFVKQALLAGKHVCTSNKELVAAHGAELLETARSRGVSFLFEASVGGGVPIIRPLNQILTTDEVTSVAGILNGTSNYILTNMSSYNKTFGEALAEAQEKGFAEKNPSADVDGFDASRKLAILLSLASGRTVNYEEIHTEGISSVTLEDFDFAKLFGYTVRLICDGRLTPDGVEASVAPMLAHHTLPLYSTFDVYNCIIVQAAMTDDVTFMGRGAGSLPTAAAIVSDVTDAVKHRGHIGHSWSRETARLLPFGGYVKKKLVRIGYSNKEKAIAEIQKTFGKQTDTYELGNYPGRIAFFTPGESEDEAAEKLSRFESVKIMRVFR